MRICAQPGKGHKDPAFSMDKDYVVRQYTSENGLPQNTARDLLYDEDGYLWIATENGLARFDGQRFRVYNNANTPAVESSMFSILFQQGHQIFATSAHPNAPVSIITRDHKIIKDTTASAIGPVFVNVHSGCIFDGAPFFTRFRNKGADDIDAALLNDLSRADTFEIINPNEMVACQKGNWYDIDKASARIIKLPAGLDKPGTRWFCLDGLFCSHTTGEGLRFFRKGKETILTADPSVSELVKDIQISGGAGFTIFRKGDMVLAKRNNNIYQLSVDAQRLKARLIYKDLDFLADQSVRCMQYDPASQRLFIGTENAGLFIVSKKNFHTSVFHTRDINNNIVSCFELLPNDKILTDHGILDQDHPDDSRLFGEERAPDWNCFYQATDRSIWFSRHHYLYRYDSSCSRELFADTTSLDSYVTSIQEDRGHTLWVSLSSSLLKMENGHLRYLVRHLPLFTNHLIQTTAQVVPGKWWIATSNGLYVYDMAAGKMEERALLPGVYVRSIYTAKDGSIWLGTYGDGYYKYVAGKFIALPLDPRQYLATAHTFLEDGKGFFWISTDHGLFRIRKNDLDEQDGTGYKGLIFYYFDRSSGLNTDEFNGGCTPASLIDRKGNFYFSSMNGIVHFDPDSMRCEWPDRPILIENVFVDSASLGDRRPLLIKHDFNQLAVDITTPFFGSEANLQLEYKLNPIGDQWYPVARDGRIFINRLPYGKYVLMIRKRSGWKPDEYTVSSLSFEVSPRWYNTRWFDLLLVGFVLLMLVLIYLFRPRILLHQNRRLQSKVNSRTAELEQSTMIKERLISVIMHDLRSPLFAQGHMIGYLEGNHKQLTEAELSDLLIQLNESNKRICQFSTDFLAWYNTRLEGFQLELYPIELASFAGEVSAFYLELAERKGLSLSVDIPPGLVLRTDRNILAIVLRNLVDNAVKYTSSGNILISAAMGDQGIYIQIRDTGAGMSALKISELLNTGPANNHKASSTYGYRLIIDLAQLIRAGLHIESEVGKGTTVVLSFKM